MRSNPAAFALSFGMGLIILLIGFLALSAAGLVNLTSADEKVAQGITVDSMRVNRRMPETASVQPASPAMLASLFWRKPGEGGEAVAMASGDALFKGNCAQCHAVNDKVVGPALAGITKRRPISWVVSWVHNSSKVIASGDEYAGKLFSDYGKQQMPAFPNLSDKDIKDIVLYVSMQEVGGVDDSNLLAKAK